MKKILGIVVLLILVVLGGYFTTGLVTERTLKKNLNTLAQSNGLSAELAEYNRGLFTSKARLIWQMQIPEKVSKSDDGQSIVVPPRNYTFDIPLVVYHGPVMLQGSRLRFGLGAATGELSLPDAYMSEFQERFTKQSTEPKLLLSFFVTYFNKTKVEADIPSFMLYTKEHPTQIDWQGLDSQLHFSPRSNALQGKLLLKGIKVMGEKFTILLQKFTTTYDVHKEKNGMFLGKAVLNLLMLEVTQDGKAFIELKKLSLKSSSDVHDALFSSDFQGEFDSLSFADSKYGHAEVKMSLKNIDADVLADLNRRVEQIQQLAPTSPEAPQLVISLIPDFPRLVEKGAVFELSTLKADLPDGALDGAMKLSFPKEADISPLKIFPKLEGEAYFKMPKQTLQSLMARTIRQQLMREQQLEMAKQEDGNATVARPLAPSILEQEQSQAKINQKAVDEAKQKVADLIQVGALQVKGNDLVLELKLSAGNLLVNGQPFHSGMLSF